MRLELTIFFLPTRLLSRLHYKNSSHHNRSNKDVSNTKRQGAPDPVSRSQVRKSRIPTLSECNVLYHRRNFESSRQVMTEEIKKCFGALWCKFWVTWPEVTKSWIKRLCRPIHSIILCSSKIVVAAVRDRKIKVVDGRIDGHFDPSYWVISEKWSNSSGSQGRILAEMRAHPLSSRRSHTYRVLVRSRPEQKNSQALPTLWTHTS